MMWKEVNQKLEKTFSFADFPAAMAFILRVGFVSEALNHHPTLENTYNKVQVRLCTHDAGNKVTEKDHQLAKAIDALVPG